MSTWFTERYYLLAKDRDGAWDAVNKFTSKAKERLGDPMPEFDVSLKLQIDHNANQCYVLVTLDCGFNALDSRVPDAADHFQEHYPQYGIQRYDYRNDDEAMILGLQPVWANCGGNAVEWYVRNVVEVRP